MDRNYQKERGHTSAATTWGLSRAKGTNQKNYGDILLYDKIFENLGEVDDYLKTYKWPKLALEETENLSRPIIKDPMGPVVKSFPLNEYFFH